MNKAQQLKEKLDMEEVKGNAGIPLNQLVKDTIKFDGVKMRIQNSMTRQFRDIQYLPFIGTKMMRFNATVDSARSTGVKPGKGDSSYPSEYTPEIRFFGIEFSPEKTQDFNVEITDSKSGKKWYIKPIEYGRDKCQVKCTCSDYIHRFAWPNDQKYNAHIGIPKKYTPVPGSNRPSVNPDNIPGLCKHLLGFVDHLGKGGFFRDYKPTRIGG